MTQVKLATKAALDALANRLQPVTPGTFLISGGSVAFAGGRSFTVAAAQYIISGTQYSSAESTVTLGAADATNPRFDAIVVDTTGTVSVVAGVASSTPAFPDIDPAVYLALSYIRIDAAASSVSVATTDIYRENAEWTSAVSANVNAASTNNPRNGTKDIEYTTAVAGNYARLSPAAAVSLAAQRQLVLYVRPKAAFPKSKSIGVTFSLGGVKVGQTVSITQGAYGFDSAVLSYQQIAIPITAFQIPSDTLVDRLELAVVGSGAAIGFYVDDVFLEGASTAVPNTAFTALQAEVDSLRIRTVLIVIDGGGAAINTGIKTDVPLDYAGKILGWRLYADVSGSIQIDLWKDTHANFPPTVADTITAAAKPTLASATKNQSTTLTGWTTSFNAGDVIRVNVDSADTLTRAVLALKTQVA